MMRVIMGPLFQLILWLCISRFNAQCDTPVSATAKDRDKRRKPNELTIVSYNAEWLYHENNCPDFNRLMGFIEDGQKMWSITAGEKWTIDDPDNKQKLKGYMDQHITNIAKYLDDINADIYVIEETCSCKVLDEVRQKMKRANFLTFLDPCESNKMQTGIISRFYPVRNTASGDKGKLTKLSGVEEMRKSRIFRAEFEIGDKGKKLILYGAHLTPGDATDTATARENIANELNKLAKIDADTAGNYVVVTGDINAHADAKKISTTKREVAGDNPTIQTIAKDFIAPVLGKSGAKVPLLDYGAGMKLYEETNNIPKDAKLIKVIIDKGKGTLDEVDCDNHDTMWLKIQLDSKKSAIKDNIYAVFRPGPPLEIADNNGEVVQNENNFRTNGDNKLIEGFELKDDASGMLLVSEKWGVPADAKLLKIIFNGGVEYDCASKNIVWLKARFAENTDKTSLKLQFHEYAQVLASSKTKSKQVVTAFTPNHLGDYELADVGGATAGIKLKKDTHTIDKNKQIIEIVFNDGRGPDGGEIKCTKHNIAWLKTQLIDAGNLAVGKIKEEIKFGDVEDDKTVSNFKKNDFACPPTSQPVDDQWSHYDCNRRDRKNGVYDYFFVSKSIQDDLDPKLEYIHYDETKGKKVDYVSPVLKRTIQSDIKYSTCKGLDNHLCWGTKKHTKGYTCCASGAECRNIGRGVPDCATGGGERKCALYSDHTPIKLTLKIPTSMTFQYSSRMNYYGDRLSYKYKTQEQKTFNSLLLYTAEVASIGVIIFFCVIGGLLCGLGSGFVVGYFITDSSNSKYILANW